MEAPIECETFTLLAHRHNVQLHACAFSGDWFLAHRASNEVRPLAELPRGSLGWELHFDNEGFGTLLAENDLGEFTAIDVSAVIGDVYIDQHGRMFKNQGDEDQPRMAPLGLLGASRRLGVVMSSVGAQLASFTLAVARFDTHQACGSRLLWNMRSVFEALHGRDAFGKTAGVWLQKIWPVWDAFCKRELGFHCLRRAQEYMRKGGEVRDSSRCLPFLSMSTVCVLLVLARVLCSDKNRGGVGDANFKHRALVLLQHILGALSDHSWQVRICCDEQAIVNPFPLAPSGRLPTTCDVVDGVLIWPKDDPRVPVSWEPFHG